MAVQIRDAGAMRQIPALRMRDGGGVVRTIKQGWLRDATNVPRLFMAELLGDVYPAEATAVQGVFDFPYTLTGAAAQIYLFIDSAPFLPPVTYHWNRTSGDVSIGATTPDAIGTQFFSNFGTPGTRVAIFHGKATDAAGRVVEGDVEVTLTTLDWD